MLMVRNRKKLESNGFENVSLVSDIVKNVIIAFFVWFVAVKLAFLKGIPTQLVIIAVIVACYAFLTEATVPGRNIYALGGNSKAARLSGINTQKVFFWVYANMSILAAVAGVVLSARNASAVPAHRINLHFVIHARFQPLHGRAALIGFNAFDSSLRPVNI